MAKDESIIIRDCSGHEELRAVEQLQKEIWGISDLDVVPLTQLVAVQATGGVLLGAFDGEELVGFVYGFVGYEEGQANHHSHMLAVKNSYRDRNLGSRLKIAQAKHVLEQGIKTMTWTFDPLQSLNAYINFSKLGVFSNRYWINFYGEQAESFLHQTGTDRLFVTWKLEDHFDSRRSEKSDLREHHEGVVPLVKVGTDEFPLSSDFDEGLDKDLCLIEIPVNINEIVDRDPELSIKWREATRKAFTEAMKRRFLVENFFRVVRNDLRLGVYLLKKHENE